MWDLTDERLETEFEVDFIEEYLLENAGSLDEGISKDLQEKKDLLFEKLDLIENFKKELSEINSKIFLKGLEAVEEGEDNWVYTYKKV